MRWPEASSPTAAELLEATKKLYVKTDVLRQRRIEPGEPRLFQFSDFEDQACREHSMFELPLEEHVKPQPKPRRKVVPSERMSSDRVQLIDHRSISIEGLQNSSVLHRRKMITPHLSFVSLCNPQIEVVMGPFYVVVKIKNELRHGL
uniref:Uncharacterized protein n=1 Tax=Angiostrongylus cantonensis TaxID=6313 RepID=A0A0K0CWY1_ANGCA